MLKVPYQLEIHKTRKGVKALGLFSTVYILLGGMAFSLLSAYCLRAYHRRKSLEAIEASTNNLLIKHLASESQLKSRLIQANNKAKAVIEAILDVVITIDDVGTILTVNQACEKMLQYSPRELLGQNVKVLMGTEDADRHDHYLSEYQRTGKTNIIGTGRLIKVKRKDGSFVQAHLSVTDVSLESGTEYVGIITDISEQIEREEKARYLALHDSLTKLPNRIAVQDRIAVGLSRTKRSGRALALLYIDLDGFKPVNDTFGHEYGDALLIKFSVRLTKQLRQSDTAARIGGDEFLVLLEELNDYKESARVAENIIRCLKKPFPIANEMITIGASIGIAYSTSGVEEVSQLIHAADQAMYQAKRSGKNQCCISEAAA